MEHKKLHEGFALFFESPSREALRNLLKNGVGETNNIDFKESFPEKTKLAKHFLAFANSGGGIIVAGVKDGEKIEAVGVKEKIDKADIQKQIAPYIPSSLEYDVFDFTYEDSEYPALKGKTFQVIIVESCNESLPYLCEKSSEETKVNVIYVRKGTNSTEASHDDVQKLINRRIDTRFSSTNLLNLEEHLKQLKMLYNEIPKNIRKGKPLSKDSILGSLASIAAMFNDNLYEYEENPNHPKESYEDFISKIIESKKEKIKQVIEI